ncbi:MAG: hypothetical protein NZT61_05780 [Deltaproteobacteria bacterium]|nr:hypothetical protein [Deltaproteobacteria bacterium]
MSKFFISTQKAFAFIMFIFLTGLNIDLWGQDRCMWQTHFGGSSFYLEERQYNSTSASVILSPTIFMGSNIRGTISKSAGIEKVEMHVRPYTMGAIGLDLVLTPNAGLERVDIFNLKTTIYRGVPFDCTFGSDDLMEVLYAMGREQYWNTCPTAMRHWADMNEDRIIDVDDLLHVLFNWGLPSCEEIELPFRITVLLTRGNR